MPPELVPHAFDPFRRGDDRRGSEGLGLGLYIARQILAAHEGSIEVSSTAEKGTTVSFTLPR
jgi:signal transduction histidine kinase